MNIESFIKKLKESEEFGRFVEELYEMSTTGGVEGYQTPKAFSPQSGEGKEAFDAQTKDNAEQFGYKIVPKQKRRNSISKEEYAKQESTFKKGGNINEASLTTGFSPINIGDSFVDAEYDEDDNEQKPHKTMTNIVRSAGYSPVYKKVANESTYKQVMSALHEASYKSYKTDETRSTNQKINQSIKELNRSIYEIERVVAHASRLKTEMGVDQRTLWSSSHKRLHKIGERLNRISKRINELGA